MTFEIKERDAAGRICRFTTRHGTVTTPTLLPVINPNKMIIPPKEMKKLFGTEIVITNSYIIHKNPTHRDHALHHGVHDLIDFDGPIMTDSGTFQSYVYGDIDIDPIEIVEFQRDIGSDIGTILDIFGTPRQTRTQAQHGIQETLSRAKKSIRVKGDMLLACTVQGSIYPDLREHCARELSTLRADFFPIGGVVPLMENQRYTDLVRVILAAKQGLDPSKPVHLFGAGHPLLFPLAVALGCDFFDSSAYAKYAQDKRMMFPGGTSVLTDLQELPCCCPVCSRYTVSELQDLDAERLTIELAKHNLFVSFSEIRRIRTAIREGTLWELVERRAYENPMLLSSLSELRKTKHKQWMERFEPISKKRAVFYTGSHTIHRPLLYRTHQRLLHRYKPLFDTTVLVPEGKKPYTKYHLKTLHQLFTTQPVNIVVNSSLGPVPLELDEYYPFAQSIFPETTDSETKEVVNKIAHDFLKKTTVVVWKGTQTLQKRRRVKKKKPSSPVEIDMDLWRISAVATMQFGRGAATALFKGDVRIMKSKTTQKIRTVFCNGEHVVSLRAEDGFFTLRSSGGKRLHQSFKSPRSRVIVDPDASPFIREGKNVFAKFVLDADPELRPDDECLIVDKKDHLLAIGRVVLNREEMLAFTYGIAVRTREPVE
ncbi:MAG: tRNA guanosine(15) transglycosylase TgtA [Methanobacteriota archaeon]